MDRKELIELFSREPAALAWSTSKDGWQTIGTSGGFVLTLLGDMIEAAAIFPPDQPIVAERNGSLFHLLLVAMRPDWQTCSQWLEQQMRLAARWQKSGPYTEHNYARQVIFTWDRQHSRATLKVRR